LLAIVGTWQHEHYLIMAMELADRTLYHRWQEATNKGLPGIPAEELLEYLHEAAKGIDHLNSIGVQHRDIKPHNLLLVGGGVKVADFGLAKLLHSSATRHTVAMTPAYAAPETFRGRTTQQSDQYSLAVTYCELRCGQLPYEGNVIQLMAKHLKQEPNLGMLSAQERSVVVRALAQNPEARWPSCRAFALAMAEQSVAFRVVPTPPAPQPAAPPPVALPEAARPSTPSPGPAGPVQLPSRNKRWLAIPLLLLVLGIATALFWPRGGSRDLDLNMPREQTNSIGMKLVLIPAGNFLMGSPRTEEGHGEDEEQHEVDITQPFYLSAYEVTQGEYQRVMGVNPSKSAQPNGGAQARDTSRFPVEWVSWEEAVEFCRKLSNLPEEKEAGRVYRLPTEAEWEYACRGKAGTSPFSLRDTLASTDANIKPSDRGWGDAAGPELKRPTQVGSYGPNGFGVYDMHGNVWEWCADWYDKGYYATSPKRDPQGPSTGSARVLRGGSWFREAVDCRSAVRNWGAPRERSPDVGFRVAANLKPGG
jgi:formylglycine-generating enzyme required for sulfatase activity